MTSDPWNDLLPHLQKLSDLGSTIALLSWDQSVMMPPKGAEKRARASATLQLIYHEMLVSPEIGQLIERLSDDDSLDQVKSASVRVLRREYDKATKVPPDLVRELAELEGLAYAAWTEARPASDFSKLAPFLEKMLELKKKQADAVGWERERYDALLDDFEPGLTAAEVEVLFKDLTSQLGPIAEKVLQATGSAPEFASKEYDPAQQEAFSRWLVEKLNFELDAGRLDTSPHPFTMTVAPGDVRQTTRYVPNELLGGVYATIHETGHALYEQGIPLEFADLPVGHVPSLGMHESQSRLWENQVGRSRAFTNAILLKLKEQFSSELGMLTPEEFYEGVNHPQRTLIRVSADELTYNLHVALRFELELALFRGELTVADLPDAWDAGMEKHLNIRPDSDANGVLQDMHWSLGFFGYFPTYTLGTLYAAALFDRASAELGDLEEDLKNLEVGRLLGWLREKIHSQGYLYTTKELGEQVLGEPLSVTPFIGYLKTKYGELYNVDLNS
ncbi:MAG: carboxypeptidase M32 [Actinomycetota bacterium]|nr:carboxypeptidase M32 [Actinomycetota bacterium]